MRLLEKLEEFINRLLILIGERIARAWAMILPKFVLEVFPALMSFYKKAVQWIKELPSLLRKNLPFLLEKLKSKFTSANVKLTLNEASHLAKEKYSSSLNNSRITALKKITVTPFLMLGIWLKGLTSAQSLVLMSFTAASFLAGINIIFSGNRMLNHKSKEFRAPASIEEEIPYERPAYYKKQNRHLEISNLRLPVYYANVNDLRNIDIDFSATLSNRLAKMQLEKLEFQLRDHLILHVEPMVASFPIQEEGKLILKDKIFAEINAFLILQQIEGEVKELEITYILAN